MEWVRLDMRLEEREVESAQPAFIVIFMNTFSLHAKVRNVYMEKLHCINVGVKAMTLPDLLKIY